MANPVPKLEEVKSERNVRMCVRENVYAFVYVLSESVYKYTNRYLEDEMAPLFDWLETKLQRWRMIHQYPILLLEHKAPDKNNDKSRSAQWLSENLDEIKDVENLMTEKLV